MHFLKRNICFLLPLVLLCFLDETGNAKSRDSDYSDPFQKMDHNNDQNISPSEWKGTVKDFNLRDRDGNGVLNVREFRRQRTGSDRFGELDYSSDGLVSRSEWHNTPQSFKRLDLNCDGKLNRQEFYNQSLYSTSVFRELDLNHDQRISRNEWRGTVSVFDRVDTNGSDFLSENELSAHQNGNLIEGFFHEIFGVR